MDSDFVDQQLLQQFSCMGTTDKDELIKQLQILVGNNLSPSTAKFFLDMNNWNLQAAVGSYFDLGTPTKLPSMTLIKDEMSTDVLYVPPSTPIMKHWMLLNNGDGDWPQGCYLQFSGGDAMSNELRFPVLSLSPNETTIVRVQLISPSMPGVYKSKWRMTTPTGSYFGDIIWVIMTVSEQDTADLAKQLSNLNTFGDSNSTHHRPDTSCLLNPFGPQPFGKSQE